MPEFLDDDDDKENTWLKQVRLAKDAGVLADLIVNRIQRPTEVGPTYCELSDRGDASEVPVDIFINIAAYDELDRDIFTKAVGVILTRFMEKRLELTCDNLQNVFYMIEQLNLECSGEVFSWLKLNTGYATSDSWDHKMTYDGALQALVYAQSSGNKEYENFWLALWEQGQQRWWNTAFNGLRFCNFSKALTLIPTLLQRKCSGAHDSLYQMWRITDDTRMTKMFIYALREQDAWVGQAINLIAIRMRWAEKNKLVERLYDNGKDDDIADLGDKEATLGV